MIEGLRGVQIAAIIGSTEAHLITIIQINYQYNIIKNVFYATATTFRFRKVYFQSCTDYSSDATQDVSSKGPNIGSN